MFGYYLDLARRSLNRNRALTALMIVAIAFGVGASMTTLTVFHTLAADPVPHKSDRLFYVQLDPRKARGQKPGDEPIEQSSRLDAENLLREYKADRTAIMTGGSVAIEPQRTDLPPFYADGRWTSRDLFEMFEVPFLAGQAWTADDDRNAARVAVIARPLAEKLFGTTEVVGKSIRTEGTELRIVGVTGDWNPQPHFHDIAVGRFSKAEQIFVPWSTSRELKLSHDGNMNCWSETGDSEALGAPCEWVQVWVELDSAAKHSAYRDFLIAYSEQEKAAGRYERAPNVRLRSVMEWLHFKEIVPEDVRLQTWIALGFLLVCLINTVGLLLTKFLRRSGEIGVRRALGASKRSIFVQLLVEAGMIGLVGGLLGLGLAYLGLWAVHHQPTPYAELAKLDMPMLALTFGLAIASSLLAGLLPAWRGCQITPAIQLKSH
jgi:putative ABC transport system permease protein